MAPSTLGFRVRGGFGAQNEQTIECGAAPRRSDRAAYFPAVPDWALEFVRFISIQLYLLTEKKAQGLKPKSLSHPERPD
jgi:hypothetical protein